MHGFRRSEARSARAPEFPRSVHDLAWHSQPPGPNWPFRHICAAGGPGFQAVPETGNNAARLRLGLQTYVAAVGHQPVASSDLSETFDAIVDEEDGASAILPRPDRHADPTVISRLFQALRANESIHIRYTSMTSGADGGQWIAPTHFTTDGESIHVRAFSFKHAEYRSYLPVRIDLDSTFNVRATTEALPWDEDWHTLARIWLQPKSDLTREQAAAVRREWVPAQVSADRALKGIGVLFRSTLEHWAPWGPTGAAQDRIRSD